MLYFVLLVAGGFVYNYATQQPQDISRVGVLALILALVILFLERKFFMRKNS
ncbi:MAG: hypothetical protein MUE85_20445 [Microscillaceae bacterium]|nr:hypothetical protein [Microscillaceae bacterium]